MQVEAFREVLANSSNELRLLQQHVEEQKSDALVQKGCASGQHGPQLYIMQWISEKFAGTTKLRLLYKIEIAIFTRLSDRSQCHLVYSIGYDSCIKCFCLT